MISKEENRKNLVNNPITFIFIFKEIFTLRYRMTLVIKRNN